MRFAFFALLAVNAAWFAWAGWIDRPARPVVASGPPLPQLRLASEAGLDAGGPGAMQPVTQLPARCVSVGPFEDLANVARAAAMLEERGLVTRQRAEQGEALVGYWVFVEGFEDAASQARMLRRLERGGITDAHAMAESEGTRRISLGVFSDRARAERRAQAAARLDVEAQLVERKRAGAVYWIDFDLTARDSGIAAEGLLATNASGAHIEIRACPTAIERPGGATSADARAGAGPRG